MLNENRQVCTNGWLATGESDAIKPEAFDAHARHAREFFVGKEIFASHPVETFGRHAISAAKIATISDRDPKVAMNATKAVNKGGVLGGHSCRLRAKKPDPHGGARFEGGAVWKFG